MNKQQTIQKQLDIQILHLKKYTLCQEENCKHQYTYQTCKTAIENNKCPTHNPKLRIAVHIHEKHKTGIITIYANGIPHSEKIKI